ncbi:MAG: hypothetical protein QM763_07275 [Agriterribacter sp.]
MKKLCTLATGLLVLMQFCSAQGVKQIWVADTYHNRLYSIDTATLGLTVRRDFIESGDGYEPMDFKVINGKIYGTMHRGAFLYEFDPISNFFDTKVTAGNTDFLPVGNIRHLDTINGNIYIFTNTPLSQSSLEDYEYAPISKWNINTQQFTKIITDDVMSFRGQPVEYNGKFYGFKERGTDINEWTPENNSLVFQKHVPVDLTHSSYPDDVKTLTLTGGKFFMLSYTNIFEWDPESNDLTLRHNFPEGQEALGSLIEKNGKLYGVTDYGGLDDKGVIFEWDPTSVRNLFGFNFA